MSPEVAKQLLFQMRRIRHVELEISRRYSQGRMRCPTHLSVGQEGVAAAVGIALRRTDLAVSGHRAHAHYLGKGGSLRAMLAEIYGKADGCSRGKGGSMHLVDEAAGFMGSTAIVGGTIPVGVGLAYGIKCKGSDQVSCIFHGDASVETGAFAESVNFAVVKQLPVLFICENNLYSVYSPLHVRQPRDRTIVQMARGLGMKAEAVNGNDAEACFNRTQDVVAEIRAGGGPRLLEFATYRWLEHCGPNFDNDLGYRTEEEYLAWKAKEPITPFEATLMARGVVTAQDVVAMDEHIVRETSDAFDFAEASPFPPPDAAYTDLYTVDPSRHDDAQTSAGH
jgi:TPP-dependent pyruvate/acetoin dehydrogenase alpha subunit